MIWYGPRICEVDQLMLLTSVHEVPDSNPARGGMQHDCTALYWEHRAFYYLHVMVHLYRYAKNNAEIDVKHRFAYGMMTFYLDCGLAVIVNYFLYDRPSPSMKTNVIVRNICKICKSSQDDQFAWMTE